MPSPILPSLLSFLLLSPPVTEAGEGALRHQHHRLSGTSVQAPPCDLLTRPVFDALAPGATSALYSHEGFCNAATGWNHANPEQQIFVAGTEEHQREELAAFLGHALHESGDFAHPREVSQCPHVAAGRNGEMYCQPEGFPGGTYEDPYCDPRGLTPGTDPDGCACGPVSDDDIHARLEANKLFFGRGPMQLSWNYNYIDAGQALGVDLCAEPELAATDEAIAWGTAIWFWMRNTGATGVSPHDAIVTNHDFGASLNTINGGLECPAASGGSVISRLDDYCRAANALGVASLSSLDGCDSLGARYTECLGAGTCPNCESFVSTTTSSPTKALTMSPLTSPTSAKTMSPTANPSKSTSTSPTEAATTSVSPTRAASKSPTKAPTTSPSKSMPSVSPTRAASKSQSTPPTREPTTSPSTPAPSVSPTPAPTRSPAPCLFYTNTVTCVNDCNEESWNAMHSTLEECCTVHHGYGGPGGYIDCTGITESPTTGPTANPLKSPSTTVPTRSPSTPAPSPSPTQAPTRSPSPCLFYTNWRTCVNDCNGEGWNTLHDTLEECCSVHHNYPGTGGYIDCMGGTESPTTRPITVQSPLTATPTRSPITPMPSAPPTRAPTRSPSPCLFYTNWRTCVNDCNEESWNTVHDTLEECCSAHHSYGGPGGYIDCMGGTKSPTPSPTVQSLSTLAPTRSADTPAPSSSPTQAPTRSPAPCSFYTTWITCVNDCNEENWNTLHDTREECCSAHHGYAGPGGYIGCMGGIESATISQTVQSPLTMARAQSPNTHMQSVSPTSSPTPSPTGSPSTCSFYTTWITCVNDCNEESWNTLHNTREECCSAHHNYGGPGGYIDCMGSTESPTESPTVKSSSTIGPTQSPNTPAPSVSPTLAPTLPPSPCLFYTSRRTRACVNDCNQESWNTLHETREQCCSAHHSYGGPGGYTDCMGSAESPTASPTVHSPSTMAPTSRSPTTPAPSVSPTRAPTRSPSPCLFYTNWSSCVNDCKQESWDTLHETRGECCSTHHSYEGPGGYMDCMGSAESPTTKPTVQNLSTVAPSQSPKSFVPSGSPTPAPTRSPSPCSFYTTWATCVNDCNEESWNTLHDTREECCTAHHGYVGLGGYIDCMGITGSPTTSPTTDRSKSSTTTAPTRSPITSEPSVPPTSAPTRSPSPCLFYTNGLTCVNECNDVDSILRSTTSHGTLEECCTTHHYWLGAGGYTDCMGITGSPTSSPTSNPSKSSSATPTRSPNTPEQSASPTGAGWSAQSLYMGAGMGTEKGEQAKVSTQSASRTKGKQSLASLTPSTNWPTPYPKIRSESPSISAASSQGPSSTTTVSAQANPCLFYTNGLACVNDCQEEEWSVMYDTIEECCTAHLGLEGSAWLQWFMQFRRSSESFCYDVPGNND